MMIKKFYKIVVIFSLCLLTITFAGGCLGKKAAPVNPDGSKNIRFLACWNGLSYLKPKDEKDNPIGNVIKQKANVVLNMEWTTGNEAESLNRIFSIGKNMPDVIMAPYWGGADASSAAIRQAVKDGLILPLDDLIEQYAPNLKDAYKVGVSSDFVKYELGNKDFGGKKYVIPMHTPADIENTQNWGYTVYAREDILKALNVDPNSITSSEDLYNLSVKIKAGNFKDVNGNPIITASTWQNGWSYECYLNSFKSRGFTNIIDDGGEMSWAAMNPLLDEEVKFMQKYVSEGLFDPSSFNQTDLQARQKHISGSVGLTAAHYPHINNNLRNTLYATNPEMRYVPLGPILDANKEKAMPTTIRDDGEYGFAVMFLTKNCRDPKAVMEYLNYINSEEGKYLAYLGQKDIDWEMVEADGKSAPRMTKEYFEKEKLDGNYSYSKGINSIYTLGVSRIPWNTFDSAWNENGNDPYYEKVKQMYPTVIKTGTRASSFDNEYENIETFRNRLSGLNYTKLVEAMYTASSQKDAMAKLATYRNNLNRGNVLNDYMDWLKTKLQDKTDILY